MIELDESALICDLAETYNIYDYRQLPLIQVAVFSYGLRDDSRIKLKMSDQKVPLDTFLLAGLIDKVSLLLWAKTEDAHKNKNRPSSILNLLTNDKKEEKKEMTFNSSEEFEAMRKKIIAEAGKGGVD
ncbi:hypothetical protein BG261_02785 [Floricoccus tropicus]|uniref:Phage protein n=1 Tax=Floricoccus tropicus TaxID=1859473 RepID=A0A1E8GMR2_9LACT|nr:DUF5361 domain-containing protein [Floricoccus tropicus]OFI49522.1 hypothetical protein BG261_02785 [Floricoccus tropicus]